MWRRVDLLWSDVSGEWIASIFRVEKSASEEPESADDSRLLHCKRSEDRGLLITAVVGYGMFYGITFLTF
jgi:hypothetical protein